MRTEDNAGRQGGRWLRKEKGRVGNGGRREGEKRGSGLERTGKNKEGKMDDARKHWRFLRSTNNH